MGKLVLVVMSLDAIPLGGLIGITRDRWLRRHPDFRARFAGFVLCVTLPALIVVALSAVRLVGEYATVVLLIGGFCWGVLLVPMALLLLFEDPGSSPGPSDDDADGPDRGDDWPSPPRPIGGLPLPDADQSSLRIRGPHSHRHAANRRRPAREPKRASSRTFSLLPLDADTPSPDVGESSAERACVGGPTRLKRRVSQPAGALNRLARAKQRDTAPQSRLWAIRRLS